MDKYTARRPQCQLPEQQFPDSKLAQAFEWRLWSIGGRGDE
jgi:hypothetical protein